MEAGLDALESGTYKQLPMPNTAARTSASSTALSAALIDEPMIQIRLWPERGIGAR